MKGYKIIINLIYTSFVFFLVYLFGLGIGVELNVFLQIIIVFLISLIINFFLFNPLILYGILAISTIITIIIHKYFTPILFTIMEKSFNLFKNIIANIQGKENITSDNILLFWIILIIFVSLFTAFTIFKKKNIYLLLPIYLGFPIYYWYNFYNEGYWVLSMFLLGFFILIGLYNHPLEKSEKLYIRWIKTVINYSILIVFLALILPKSYNYIEWSWLQKKVYTAFPFVENLRSYDDFSRKSEDANLFNFSITGFQDENSKLGGPVKLSDKKIMTVRSNNDIYLRGNVKQIYTGDSWDTVPNISINHKLKENFGGLSREEQKNYYKEDYITITYHNFASITLFSPYKPTLVSFENNNILKVNQDDTLIFPDGIYDGESYTVIAQRPLPYGMLLSHGIDKKKDIIDLETYLQIPKNKITKRTKDLVKKIVLDRNTDFEKAVAIENYLRNNYEYSLDVDNIPAEYEFIDYFLFEEQKGYCTYYATSMALMLRLSGIPSRYVEGYLVNDPIEEGIYEVRHRNAHAWVEAFIEPVGWMGFEPTPAYSIQPRLEDYKPIELTKDLEINKDIENTNNNNINIDRELVIDEGFLGEMISPKESNENMPNSNISSNTIYFFIILLLIVPIRFLVGFLKYIYEESKAKKLSNNERIIYLYSKILKLKEHLGYPQLYGETHYEYGNRVAYKFYSHNEIGLKEITEIFVKSKYSDLDASDKDVLELERYRRTMEIRLRAYLGWVRYYYWKYVKLL